jgi:hypothetical protein
MNDLETTLRNELIVAEVRIEELEKAVYDIQQWFLCGNFKALERTLLATLETIEGA